MTEQEVLTAARSDEDAKPPTEGELEEFRPVPTVDVKAVRRRLGLSQAAFATRFGVNLRTVQDWEQGRRRPEGPARLLLAVIERDPDVVPRVLGAPQAKTGKAGKRDIHVVPHPAGGWAIRLAGASRVSARHATQRAAIAAARVRASRERVAVVVHRRDGTVRAGAG
jgi:putative transcriptional regulator